MKMKSRLKYRRNLKRIKREERSLPNGDYWFVGDANPVAVLFANTTTIEMRMRNLRIGFEDLDDIMFLSQLGALDDDSDEF
jgi:hypothetical protein